MGVGVQGESSGEVAQHSGDGLDIYAVLERQRGEGVSKVVETDFWQTCPLQHPVEHMEDTVRGDGAARGGREYILAGAAFFLLRFQNVYCICRQRQGAVGVFRFQWCFNYLAVLPGNGPLDF